MIESIAAVLDPVVRYGLPCAALVLSLASFLVAMRNWRESNRPIVAVAVRTNSAGNEAITYDLVVINAGSRPACQVVLNADLVELAGCVEDPSRATESDPMWIDARLCLSGEREIPLLLHGKEAANSFGYTGGAAGKGSFWKYGSTFEVRVSYCDLTGRRFTTRQKLEIRDSDGFAGGKWSGLSR